MVHGVYNCHKSIGTEEVWGSGVLHDGPPFIQDLPVGSFSDSILFRCMQHSELKLDSTFSTILLKEGIDIFATMVGS